MCDKEIQIILVTFNRAEKLKNTFKQIFAEKSPIKDFDITVLDNNSTDETPFVIKEYQKQHKNLKYIKHNYNIGANANIARAYELSNKDYLWILCDDDYYDFSAWAEVEEAVKNNESLIMVSKYALPKKHVEPIHLLIQATFTPSIILSRKLLDDTVLRNIYDNIYTMYVQLVPVVMALNSGINFYLIKGKAIIDNGEDYGAQNSGWYHSPNYHRGAEAERLYFKNANMSQPIGIINAIEALTDKELKNTFIKYQNKVAKYYFKPFSKDFVFFSDLWINMSKKQKFVFLFSLLNLNKIFSLYRSGEYINICFFGIKTHLFKIKKKKRN